MSDRDLLSLRKCLELRGAPGEPRATTRQMPDCSTVRAHLLASSPELEDILRLGPGELEGESLETDLATSSWASVEPTVAGRPERARASRVLKCGVGR